MSAVRSAAVGIFDVAVIGNGVLGMSTALALLHREPRLRVCLVGPRGRPHAASAAAGAMLGCFGEVTRSLLASTPGRMKLSMAFEAAARWPEWLDVIGVPRERGANASTLIVADPRSPIEKENVDAIRRSARELGAPCEELDPREIRSIDPAEAASRVALFLPTEGSVDASLLLASLEQALDRMPCFAWVDDTAASLVAVGDRISSVTLAGGSTLETRKVLVAAGAHSQLLLDTLPELARRIPRLFAGVGEALVLEHALAPFPYVVRSPNRAFARGVHLVPRSAGSVYVGATNDIQAIPSSGSIAGADTTALVDEVVRRIHRGLASARTCGAARGLRPLTADGWPLIGDTSIAGLFVLTGTYRDGLHLSPLLAADMAERILGRPSVIDHSFAPERRLIAARSREDAIEETAQHLRASAIENAHAASVKDAPMDSFRDRARSIYDGLDCASVLPVDFAGMAERDPDRVLPMLGEYYRRFEAAWT